VKLTVGKIWACALLDWQADIMALGASLDWVWINQQVERDKLSLGAPYAAIKRDEVYPIRFWYSPKRESLRVLSQIAEAHADAVDAASTSGVNSQARRWHNPGLVEALARITGCELPQPAYVADERRYVTSGWSPEERHDANGAIEGEAIGRMVDVRERDARARAMCIDALGSACQACGFDFGLTYGLAFAGRIHVHHKRPLRDGARLTDPVQDLVPVCANCHYVMHLRADPEPYTVEEVKMMLGRASLSGRRATSK
jgi:predicted HNH restriction endonuclease